MAIRVRRVPPSDMGGYFSPPRLVRLPVVGIVAAIAILLLGASAGYAGQQPRHAESSGVGYSTPHLSVVRSTTIAGPLAPSVGGQWTVLSYQSPVRGIHAVMGPTGQVLLIAGSGNDPAQFAAGTFKSTLWDPITGSMTPVDTPADMFCGGHVILPDGNALVYGGTLAYKTDTTQFRGLKTAYVFNFTTKSYQRVGDMAVGRWYASGIKDGSGNVVAVSGYDENGQPTSVTEKYDWQARGWTTLTQDNRQWPNYPSLFLTKTGELFFAGTFTPGQVRSVPVGFWNLTNNTFRAVNGFTGNRGAAAAGFIGPVQDQRLITLGGNTAATAVINLNAARPVYAAGPPLLVIKHYLGYSQLLDRTALETNGGTGNNLADAVKDTAILNQAGTAWTRMNPSPVGRLYHSVLFTLPSAKAASLSSNPDDGEFDMTIAIFSPPYLFKGPLPVITSAPTSLSYGQSYSVAATASGATIASASLLTLPSVTHSTDVNQRLVDLAYSNGTITVPTSGNIAPPGFYMLSVLDSLGRPSVATIARLG